MSEKNDFIQLPPIKKDTSSDVVAFIWEYMKIPENSREKVFNSISYSEKAFAYKLKNDVLKRKSEGSDQRRT